MEVIPSNTRPAETGRVLYDSSGNESSATAGRVPWIDLLLTAHINSAVLDDSGAVLPTELGQAHRTSCCSPYTERAGRGDHIPKA